MALALAFRPARRRPPADRTTWAGRPTEPAGLEKAQGLITGAYNKDVTDARWKRAPPNVSSATFVVLLVPRQLSCPFALLTV